MIISFSHENLNVYLMITTRTQKSEKKEARKRSNFNLTYYILIKNFHNLFSSFSAHFFATFLMMSLLQRIAGKKVGQSNYYVERENIGKNNHKREEKSGTFLSSSSLSNGVDLIV